MGSEAEEEKDVMGDMPTWTEMLWFLAGVVLVGIPAGHFFAESAAIKREIQRLEEGKR